MLASRLIRLTRNELFRQINLLSTNLLKSSACYVFQRQKSLSNVPENRWKNSDPNLPPYFNFFEDVIKEWAIKETNKAKEGSLAFYHVCENGKETKWSYQELVLRTERTAGILRKFGLKRKDKIIVILPRIPEWWLITLAAIQLGIISSPGTTLLRSKDILHRLNVFQPHCIFTNYEIAERVDEISKKGNIPEIKILCSEDGRERKGWLNFKTLYNESEPVQEVARTEIHDPLGIFFTSGTTGLPKMVQQSHSMAYKFRAYLGWWMSIEPSDVIWNLADTGWAKAIWGSFFYPWTFGSCVFIYHSPKFDAKTTIQILQKYPITNFCAPATGYKMLLKFDLRQYKFAHLKHCSTGGELLTESVIKEWENQTGLYIDSIYGQSESPLLCSTYACPIKKHGSIGIAHKDIKLSIVDEAGKEMADGEEGDIGIKIKPYYPIGLFQGYLIKRWKSLHNYFNDAKHAVSAVKDTGIKINVKTFLVDGTNEPEKTKERFRGDYYITGDRGYRDKDGYFWFMGRSDEIINSSGYRIGPFEIENALQEHPAVVESAVVGTPDPTRGEIVKAFVVLKDEFRKVDNNEMISILQEHVKRVTAPYKYPRKIEFVKELPKTITGKVQRSILRAKEFATW